MMSAQGSVIGNVSVARVWDVTIFNAGRGICYPRSRKPDLGMFSVVAESAEVAIVKARVAYEEFRKHAQPKDEDGFIRSRQEDPGKFEVESVTLKTEFLVL